MTDDLLAEAAQTPDAEISTDGLNYSRRGRALIGQEMFKVLERAKRLEDKGAYVYHLELGNPRQRAPRQIIDKTIDALQQHQVGYTYSGGIATLRDGVARRYSTARRTLDAANVSISPANLLINQFLDLSCDPGDRLVLFTPAFPTYWAAAALVGVEVVPVPLAAARGYDLTDADIDRALAARPKAIFVNSANNPTGAVYRQSVLERLAAECHRRRIWLLSDETYAEVCFAQPFFSLSNLDYPRQLVISSFSKMFSIPGYRMGFAIGEPALIDKIALSTSTLLSCLPIFTQLGCAAGLAVLDRYAASVRGRCAQAVTVCEEILATAPFLGYILPKSGFYFFVDISSTGLKDMDFATRLLEEVHTAVTPGCSFGPAYTDYIRVATCGRLEDVREGLTRLVGFARKHVS